MGYKYMRLGSICRPEIFNKKEYEIIFLAAAASQQFSGINSGHEKLHNLSFGVFFKLTYTIISHNMSGARRLVRNPDEGYNNQLCMYVCLGIELIYKRKYINFLTKSLRKVLVKTIYRQFWPKIVSNEWLKLVV